MSTTANTYVVEPTDGHAPYEITAKSYEFDSTSGRHLFKNGEELVANLLNVSVRKK